MSQKILQWSNKQEVMLVKQQLKSQGIVLGSTDTVLGLFARCNLEGKVQLDRIKSRSEKPYIILINTFDIINEWADSIDKQAVLDLIGRAWPGPLTIIIKANAKAPVWLQGSEGTLAFRWPNHEGIELLLVSFGLLLSTSANRSAQPTPHSYAELDPYFKEHFPSIILDDVNHCASSSSTIVDCSVWPFRIVRQGSYKIE